jgi:benzoyl-CoA reductase/2-hydroxyglutaryl-CoA dehydratase subunit BcrC/BadD/HgdB
LAGDIPKPDLVVHPLQPCDSARVIYSNIAEILEVPSFAVDIPMWKNERAFQYIADQYDKLVYFLEENTGRKLEYERLKEVMQHSNRAHEYYHKLNELKKEVPSPLGYFPRPPISNLAGVAECGDFTEKLYEIGKAKLEKGEGFLPEEKIRLGWFSTTAPFDTKLVNWMQSEFGCNVINTMTGTFPGPIEDISSTRKIFEGLARQLFEMPMTRECVGLAEDWIEYAIPICEDYKLDAVFLTMNVGCKHAWALGKLLKDEIADRVGIPTLVTETDSVDSRVVSAESIRKTIKDFFGTML